jgi:3-oxoacyl-[acyl-carrier protein] reductase
MDLNLDGKIALVAGASAGIGAAAARALAGEGVKLALAARSADKLRSFVEELKTGGAEALAVPADLSESGAGEAAIQATLDRYGRLDILVISIGAAQGGVFWDLDDSVWENAFTLKFMGMIRLLRIAAPIMKAQRSGAIVVVVGNNGKQVQARLAPGAAVNAACLAAIKALADELAPHGVRVNAVNPGPTRTGRWDSLMTNLSGRTGRSAQEEEAGQLAMIPLGRINEADEVGRLIAVLASDVSGTMTGASVTLDGGATKAMA